jgi:proteic killer suppression protein
MRAARGVRLPQVFLLRLIAYRYTINSVIRSFRCPQTERLFRGERVRRFSAIERTALRKLIHLNRARALQDLAQIPGDHLEALKGDRKGQHSIRVNDQYRICFVWAESDARDVEIVDYH